MSFTIVLGGARSGKSRHAEQLIEVHPAPWTYIATAQAWDDEMRERISLHRARRPPGWTTVEAPIALPEAIRAADNGQAILVDCLTLWLTNVMLSEADVAVAREHLLTACRSVASPLVLVSSEVGFGIVPDNALARRFRDELGTVNQALAREATHVVLTVAGLPLKVK
jgi:adenosylcobinamide kinase/adenosylcobinamide-phosphate guanylyltransferase